jgi:hypothetical protein
MATLMLAINGTRARRGDLSARRASAPGALTQTSRWRVHTRGSIGLATAARAAGRG